MKQSIFSPLSVLLLGSALAVPVLAQTSAQAGTSDGTAQPPQTIPAARSTQSGSMNPSDDSTYATGKPLAGQSKEGFWGHMNPFARKTWVKRQVGPIKDRTNELDQLQAKNANDIRDVDARSQAGISRATASANTADQHAADARQRADAAQSLAADASNRTASLNGTVSNLDQYQLVASTPIAFVAGRTTLGPKGKSQIDELASKLATEKGYIIEVQGYSRSGVQSSQAMADSVVRYLVTQHQVPIYRLYKTGLGKTMQPSGSGEPVIKNGVVISLMHNSLATLSPTSASTATGHSSALPGPAATGTSNPASNQ